MNPTEELLKHLLGKAPSPVLTQVRADAFQAGYDRAVKQPNFKGDVSGQHRHVSVTVEKGGEKFFITESCGFLGSTNALRHDSPKAHHDLSHLTGDHAAHRIPRHAGGADGPENLARFHPKMNQVEQYHRVEKMLQQKIKSGSAIFVMVRDVSRVASSKIKSTAAALSRPLRPQHRIYEWIEIKDNKMISRGSAPIHPNFSPPPKPTANTPPAKPVQLVQPDKVVVFPGSPANKIAPMKGSYSGPKVVAGTTVPKTPKAVAATTPGGNVIDLTARRQALRVSQYQSQTAGSNAPVAAGNVPKSNPNSSSSSPIQSAPTKSVTAQSASKPAAISKSPNVQQIRNALKSAPIARTLGSAKMFNVVKPSAATKVISQTLQLIRRLLPLP